LPDDERDNLSNANAEARESAATTDQRRCASAANAAGLASRQNRRPDRRYNDVRPYVVERM
jgi:hypothetical protein